MKALVLAGGRGTRLDELSTGTNKCMLTINGKHVIEYSLDYAASTEVDEIVLVVGYRAEDIINYVGTDYHGKRIRYVIQWEQKGLVHAIEYARDALNGSDFMLLLGDEILVNPRHQAMICEYNHGNSFGLCGVLKVPDKNLIRRTYTFIQDADGNIFRLVEKPRNPLSNFMGTGDCIFNNEILEYIDMTPIHHERKEKELPDLIQCAIDDGNRVKSFLICDKYTNINSVEDVRLAESFFNIAEP